MNELKASTRYWICAQVTNHVGWHEDDQGNYTSPKTRTTIAIAYADNTKELYETLTRFEDMAADYGDGATGARVIAVADMHNGMETMPTSSLHYAPEPEVPYEDFL